MHKTRYSNTLLKLRQNHFDETKKFYLDERCLVADLGTLCRARLFETRHPLDKAKVTRLNWVAVKELKEDRGRRYVALKRRHQEEIDNFVAFREESFLRTVGVGYA
jgi:hypothetical protein